MITFRNRAVVAGAAGLLRLIAMCFGISALAQGCSSDTGSAPPGKDNAAWGQDATTEMGSGDIQFADAQFLDAGSDSDAGEDKNNDAAGPPDDACALARPDGDAVFVSLAGSLSPTGCGSEAVPCSRISYGLAQAKSRGSKTVYIASGTYVEAVHLDGDVTLRGGWEYASGRFARVCTQDATRTTRIKAPPSSNITVSASAGTSKIDSIAVEGMDAAQVQAGASIYGVFASGIRTTLELSNVGITIPSAGRGRDGMKGADGQWGIPLYCPPGGSGSNGTSATVGTTKPPQYTANGFAPGDGTAGSDGSAGDNGMAPPSAATCRSDCYGFSYDGTNPCSCMPNYQVCANGGVAGCGGAGGKAGRPGTGGGSSIAVFAWDAAVTLSDSALTSGDGGDGGTGGLGGLGVAGGTARTPDRMNCPLNCIAASTRFDNCTSFLNATVEGAVAGSGGNGSDGGRAGSGTGGDTYAVYAGGAARITDARTTLIIGRAGRGGAGASDGHAAVSNN